MNNSPNHHYNQQGDETRKRIMSFLLDHQVVVCPLSIREIAEGAGVSPTTVSHHLGVLARLGKIIRPEPRRKYNHIQIVQEDSPMLAIMRPISRLESTFLVKWLIAKKSISADTYEPAYFLKYNVGAVINELAKGKIKVSEEEVLIALRRMAGKR